MRPRTGASADNIQFSAAHPPGKCTDPDPTLHLTISHARLGSASTRTNTLHLVHFDIHNWASDARRKKTSVGVGCSQWVTACCIGQVLSRLKEVRSGEWRILYLYVRTVVTSTCCSRTLCGEGESNRNSLSCWWCRACCESGRWGSSSARSSVCSSVVSCDAK